jgi:hypothetical protein
MNNIALLMFHQGWTDIVNCLPLINWYSRKYSKLYVILREDATNVGLFYVRGLRNVVPIFIPKQQLDINPFAHVDIKHHKITHFEFIGHYDDRRLDNDPYNRAYSRLNEKTDYPFEKLFYESYDIPYIERVNSFQLYRDVEGEEAYYNKMVKREPYICVHATSTYAVVPECDGDYDTIELAESTTTFFDAIRVLQHAKSIHVIDSVWAGVCYMIDAKYGMLENVPVFIYCHRDFYRMFTQPVKLPNWTIVQLT